MGVKKCPNCGGIQFKAEIIYGGIVESTENGFELKHKGDKYMVRPVACGCGKTFTNGIDDLVETKQCVQCGRYVDDVDENGKCEICRLLEVNPEYANMSTDALLKCIFKQQQALAQQKAQDKIHTPADSVVTQQPFPPVGDDGKFAPAPAEQQPVQEEPAEEVSEAAKEKLAGAQEAVAAAKAGAVKKGKSKRKKKEQPAEQQEETAAPQQPVQEEPAPAPQPEASAMNPPVEEQQTVQQTVQQPQNPQGDFESWMTGGDAAADPFSNGPDLSTSFGETAPASTGNTDIDAMFGTEADDGQQAF